MKAYIILLVISFASCKTTQNIKQQGMSVDYDLVNKVLSSYSSDGCLQPTSIRLDFKFPEEFKNDNDLFTDTQLIFIEKELEQPAITWNVEKLESYVLGKGKNCLQIARPIMVENSTMAFIYLTDGQSEFYDVYQLNQGQWDLKENLITLIN